jgi:hypothetical protein
LHFIKSLDQRKLSNKLKVIISPLSETKSESKSFVIMFYDNPLSQSHGGVGLDHVGGHARAPAKPRESRVYDGSGAHELPRSRGSHIPCADGGYVMACTVFYEGGFGEPSHQFLHSMLHFYGLELHHSTPSRILCMAAFVTLCEAYMGIEPHFNMWNYFFRACLL